MQAFGRGWQNHTVFSTYFLALKGSLTNYNRYHAFPDCV